MEGVVLLPVGRPVEDQMVPKSHPKSTVKRNHRDDLHLNASSETGKCPVTTSTPRTAALPLPHLAGKARNNTTRPGHTLHLWTGTLTSEI